MWNSMAVHLAERFAADAAALRARATTLRAKTTRGPGPTADACLRMADACDRVRAVFLDAADDAAVRALLPTLAGMVAGAKNAEERNVYAGAVTRAKEALDGDDDEHDADAEADAEDDA